MEWRHFLTNSLQYILVTAVDWNSVDGTLTLFERESIQSEWRPFASFHIVLGKNGLAWGSEIHTNPDNANPVKKEGDLRAPAGIFNLSIAFGYEANEKIRWPYLVLNDSMKGVDDPGSQYYNCIVDEKLVQKKDWKSAELMKRDDGLYKYGLVIDHNMYPAMPGKGSCIFMHIWRGPGMGTEGCTAMPEEKMKMLLEWLDPDASPVLIQLPSNV